MGNWIMFFRCFRQSKENNDADFNEFRKVMFKLIKEAKEKKSQLRFSKKATPTEIIPLINLDVEEFQASGQCRHYEIPDFVGPFVSY